MYVCESTFHTIDDKNPRIFFAEIDVYAWIPVKWRHLVPNHRLIIRRVVKTGEYELFRYQYDQLIGGNKDIVIIQPDLRNTKDIVIFRSKSLQEICDYANFSWNYFHKCWSNQSISFPFAECKHTYSESDMFCKKPKTAGENTITKLKRKSKKVLDKIEVKILEDIWVKPLDSRETLIPKGSKVEITQDFWKYAFFDPNGDHIGSLSEGRFESIRNKERSIYSR